MAHCTDFVTEDVLKQISTLPRREGRQLLCESLLWNSLDEEGDLRSAIVLDCLYDNISFCIDNHFCWNEILGIFHLVNAILDGARCNELTGALMLYNDKYRLLAGCVDYDNLKTFTEFFFKTFMPQYSLYQFVMRYDRDQLKGRLELLVNAPPCIPHFETGKEESIWNYEQKLKAIEERELERQETIKIKKKEESARDKALLKEALLKEALLEEENTERNETDEDVPTKREVIVQIINDVTKAHISALSHSIHLKIEDFSGEIDYMLHRTILPRPAVLGPPPRFEMGHTKDHKLPKTPKPE